MPDSRERSRSPIALGVVLAALALSLGRVPAWAVGASLESDGEEDGARLVSGSDGARVLVDPVLGQHIRLSTRPQRIVSLTLASDVMLASLVPVDRVVGVTALVDDPAYSRAADRYPGSIARVAASAEALLSLEPDLVVIAGYSHPSTVRALVGAGTPVLRLPSGRSLDEIRDALVLLADAVGAEDRAQLALDALVRARTSLASLPPLEPRPRALFLATGGFTHGRGTLTDELIRLAGAENIARERGIVGLTRIGAELIASADADVIVVAAASHAEARASLASLAPGVDELLSGVRVIAIPPGLIETTTPEVVEAALLLRRALEVPPDQELRP